MAINALRIAASHFADFTPAQQAMLRPFMVPYPSKLKGHIEFENITPEIMKLFPHDVVETE